jgi:hypothetical protein
MNVTTETLRVWRKICEGTEIYGIWHICMSSWHAFNRQKVEIIVKVSAVVGKYEQPYCFPEKRISQWEGTDRASYSDCIPYCSHASEYSCT